MVTPEEVQQRRLSDVRTAAGELDLSHPPQLARPALDGNRGALLPEADEIFRTIYTRAALGVAPEVVAVTSAIAGEGKTTVCIGLATTIAQDLPDVRVVLVETNYQQPVLARDFDVAPVPGVVECVNAGEPLEAALRPTFLPNLDLLPAGGSSPTAGRPLRSARMVLLLDNLRQFYDLVLLDTPALLVNSDALVLSDVADAALVVVRAGITPAPLITKAIDQLDPAKMRGVVLNSQQSAAPVWLRRLWGM